MKSLKLTYRISTAILSIMMVFSAYSYITNPQIKTAFTHLGFPDYFRIELAIAKLIGAVLLFLPLPVRMKEWVYAGFTITFISAFISHMASGDPTSVKIMPLLFLIPLSISYFSYHKLQLKNRTLVS